MKGENTPAGKADVYFRNPNEDEETAKQIRKKERAADAAKTAKLRRLRLEKEAADKEAADKAAAEKGSKPAKKAAVKKERKKPPVRLIY